MRHLNSGIHIWFRVLGIEEMQLRKISAIEMGWLRRIFEVSRLQKLRNEFI